MKSFDERFPSPSFSFDWNKLKSRAWPPSRTTAQWSIVVGAIAALLGVSSLYLRQTESPEAAARRERANDYRSKAKLWGSYAGLSDDGAASVQAAWLGDPSKEEPLSSNHFQHVPGPTDPEQAVTFDRNCAQAATRCRTMQKYYNGLSRKWEYAAANPSQPVAPDPPPPLPIEPSSAQDVSY